MISFKNVTRKFGSMVALDDATFEIESGEFVFITGPSGAGKTTLLRLILREMLPTSGHILVGKRDISTLSNKEVPLYRRNIGMIFQDFKLLADRTILENVDLPLSIKGMTKTQREKEVFDVLSRVGLKDKALLFPHQLAGGELQRAVIARSLVGRPLIILADEPTGNLDPDTAWEIVELLDKIRDEGKTIIMATHNRDIVDKMSKHIIELKGGKVTRDKDKGKYKED